MADLRSQDKATTSPVHVPVMLDEVLRALALRAGGVYVDGTFGAGGYTRAILDTFPDITVYAIDRDPAAFGRAQKMAQEYEGRLKPLLGCFGDAASLLAQAGVTRVDGMVFDIGVSSIQLETPERGFSFQSDGPLDMRMGVDGESAADVVNTYDERALADIIFQYGDERAARRIAKRIVTARAEAPITRTLQLADIVHSVVPMHKGLRTDTATRTFQALRIFVNDELGELGRALVAAENLIKPDGRLVVVSFHSLEDACVKRFLRDRSGYNRGVSRHLPDAADMVKPTFAIEVPGGVAPSDEETARNPRARSARLRYGIRTAEAPHA